MQSRGNPTAVKDESGEQKAIHDAGFGGAACWEGGGARLVFILAASALA
jgi:hypothetical protein